MHRIKITELTEAAISAQVQRDFQIKAQMGELDLGGP
jgi:hypothetical protein